MATDEWSVFADALSNQTEPRYRDRQVAQYESRDIPEGQYYDDIIKLVETVTGQLSDWQKFWIAGIVSGRRVEWAQARRGPHYHIVGLPCSICGRR